ncbi:hypothetical protein MACK_002413 [Theileria orientalis]|uniref:CCAAT-binding factor domain-containing protein n=1 Tax=Theileria orientalis TaxID=68886 RepID=A0A976ME73_THEOR|nr:hypothetical protein MACK_002413 [Theileria orientalis]
MESSNIRFISEETINKLLTVYTNNKWHSLPATLSSSLPPAKRSTLLTGLSGLSVEKIGKIGRELMYSISKKYVLLVCKTDFEQKWLHTTADDPFVPRVGRPPKDRKSPKKLKSSKTGTFADRVDSIAVLIHNNCVFNWAMFNQLLNLAKSDKLRIKSKCTDLMYSSFMEVLPLRKLKYIDEQDVSVLEYLSSSLRSWVSSSVKEIVTPDSDSEANEEGEQLHKPSTNGVAKRGPKGSPRRGPKAWDMLEFDALTLLLAVSFEDYLKGIYSSFIHELADMMNRGVDFLQKNSSNLVLQMLIQKPEQEDLLLDLIINRLTHKNNKMSSYVFKMLDTLLLNHRDMKTVVVKKILSQLDSLVIAIESLLNSLIVSNDTDNSSINAIADNGSFKTFKVESPNKSRRITVNGNKGNSKGVDGQRLTRKGAEKSFKISTRKMLNNICSELVPILKNIYRFLLYISKLQYSKSDAELVSMVMNNNVRLLLLFTGRPPKLMNGVPPISKGSPNSNSGAGSNNKDLNESRTVLVAGLYRLDECNRVIKVLLLFTNKLLNYYKKLNLYEEKRNLLITNGIDKNLYHLSRETRSSSITILLLLILHNIDPVNNSYINVLYENVFNTKLYESSNILKFLNLVEQILETNKDFTTILMRKLLQMGLCNYNNSINCAIIDLIQKYINEGNLWDLYLYNSTYNPHLIKSITNVNARVTRSATSKAGIKLDSFGTFSGSGTSSFSSQGLAKPSANIGSGASTTRSGTSVSSSSSGGAGACGKSGEDKYDGDIAVHVTSSGGGSSGSPNTNKATITNSGISSSAKNAGKNGSARAVGNTPSNITGLYDELNVFSNCSKVDYTFEKYWANNKQPELHQKSFELYYKARSSILSSEAHKNGPSGTLTNGSPTGKVYEQSAKRKLDGDGRDGYAGANDKDAKAKGGKDVKASRKGSAPTSAPTGNGTKVRTDRGSGTVKGAKTGTRNGTDAGSLVGKPTPGGAAATGGRKKRRVSEKSQGTAEDEDLSEDDSDIEIDEPRDDELYDSFEDEPTDSDDSSYYESDASNATADSSYNESTGSVDDHNYD